MLFLLPAVIYVAIFYVYPILLNVVMSLQRYTARSFVTGEAPFVGFGNFNRLFSNPDFTLPFRIRFCLLSRSLTFQFILGLALAVFFTRLPFERTFTEPVSATLACADSGVGRYLGAAFRLDYGVLNYILRSLGVIQQPMAWLIDPRLAPISVLIANVWIGIPFNP